ncbi:hypothetical protein AnaeK_2021 [Anaeromyxobacter sp. K]|nr:hypothetical protein AnaeK_2021 [Anaeromyxobacter sp. K]
MSGAVIVAAAARRAVGLREAALPVHAVFVGDAGDRWLVRADGGLDAIISGGLPHGRSAAADPAPGRRSDVAGAGRVER